MVQRRGSGGASIDDWRTPRFAYQNTNMLAQLSATLDNAAKVDALVQLRVGDDVAADAAKIESITLHILLSDPATKALPAKDKIDRVSINPFWGNPQLFTSPPRKGIEHRTEVRLNGVLLDKAVAKKGWLVAIAQ